MKKFKIFWSENAKQSLKNIYLYYKPKSLQGAKKVRNDILKKVKEIVFAKQYQIDEINSKYRRIVVRNYKILYLVKENRIEIIDIISSKRSPLYLKSL